MCKQHRSRSATSITLYLIRIYVTTMNVVNGLYSLRIYVVCYSAKMLSTTIWLAFITPKSIQQYMLISVNGLYSLRSKSMVRRSSTLQLIWLYDLCRSDKTGHLKMHKLVWSCIAILKLWFVSHKVYLQFRILIGVLKRRWSRLCCVLVDFPNGFNWGIPWWVDCLHEYIVVNTL